MKQNKKKSGAHVLLCETQNHITKMVNTVINILLISAILGFLIIVPTEIFFPSILDWILTPYLVIVYFEAGVYAGMKLVNHIVNKEMI